VKNTKLLIGYTWDGELVGEREPDFHRLESFEPLVW
jgi:hypothetical protein